MLLVLAFMGIALRSPYVPTPRSAATRMITLAALKPGDRVVDLGAGDARLLIAAARACPGITAIGAELVPPVWLLGKLNIWRSRACVALRLADAFQQDLRDTDVLFLYLMPELMDALEMKCSRELRPGTRVVSNTFPFPNRPPAHREVVKTWWGEKKIFVYRW